MSLDEPIEVSDPERLVANPLVSVLMITYNHAALIAAAIEGVVAQVCDFPFELVIGEDASSDDTLRVALEYQRRYPQIVRVIHAPKNVGMNANARRIFRRARGVFVAPCEGDDFWLSPHKLAGQMRLIAADPAVGVVHSDWVRAHFRDGAWKFDPKRSVHRRVPLRLLQGDLFKTWHFPKILRTCTLLVRRDVIEDMLRSELGQKEYRFGDSVLSAFVTSRWKVAYLPEVTAVYRESPNSVLRSGAAARVAFYKSCIEFDRDARRFFADRAGYPGGYRWEVATALLLWSWRARDHVSMRIALHDLKATFGLFDFIFTGVRTIAMRLPTLRRQPRVVPRIDVGRA